MPRRPNGFEMVPHVAGEDLEVALVGELDMKASFELEAAIERLLDHCTVRRAVLDLADLEFLDSAGLGALLTIRDRAQNLGIELRIANPSHPVRRVLEMTGTASLLQDRRPGD